MSITHIFITGSSKGIGYAFVKTILKEKSNVKIYGYSRNQTISHHNYNHLKIDLSKPSFIEKINFNIENISIDDSVVLINNAGIINPVKRVGFADNNEINDHFNINLVAPVLLINKFCRNFVTFKGKKLILNISSGAARRPIDGWSCYCSGKSGLEMFSKTVELENEIHNTGFRIFSISPGIIDTPMQEIIRSSDSKEFTLKNEFVRYKKEKLLKDPFETSEHLIDIIYNTGKYKNTLIEF